LLAPVSISGDTADEPLGDWAGAALHRIAGNGLIACECLLRSIGDRLCQIARFRAINCFSNRFLQKFALRRVSGTGDCILSLMGSAVMSGSDATVDLLQQAARGDQSALRALLEQHRPRMQRMVRLRLNRRLQGRIDEEDILQEAFVDVARRLPDYLQNPAAPFFLWLRQLVLLKLAELHRHHLGAQMRDANREISIYNGALPEADSVSLAAHLLGSLTSPSQAAMKAERSLRLQEALNNMESLDREVLALRHLEQLSNAETAEVLGLSPSGTTARHMRALKRLRMILEGMPGFFE
jgi:RNA polymerase sigma-70 factor (ECF subfamily)